MTNVQIHLTGFCPADSVLPEHRRFRDKASPEYFQYCVILRKRGDLCFVGGNMSISVLAVVLPNATAVLMLLIAPFRKRGPTDTRYFETRAAVYFVDLGWHAC